MQVVLNKPYALHRKDVLGSSTFEAIPNIAITVVGNEEILQLLVICSILVVLQIQIQFVNYICICKYYL